MRLWLIAGTLALVAGHPAIQQQNAPPKYEQQRKQPPAPVKAPRAALTPPSQPTANKKEHQSDNKAESKYLDTAFGPDTLPGWALVIIGLAALWATVRTLSVIRRQTDATEIAAKAARDNVQATKASADAALLTSQSLINSERAWIRVQSRRDSSEDHALEFANLGRTPAKVIRYEFAVCLPPYMDFDAADLFVLSAHTKEYGAFIAPDQSIEVERFWIGKLVTDEQWKSVESREKSIVLKGKVYYRDVVNDANEHLTVYCFYFSRDDVAFQKPAQAERNTYT